MFFTFGPDGSHEGVGCGHCRRVWYSESAANKVHEDALAQGDHGHDPRFDQLDFDHYYMFGLGRDDSFVFYCCAEDSNEDTDVAAPSDRSSDQNDESA